ncbi:MAG: riboflavin biosynthesis protein RibF [Spirochaetae bacterium HGW-Spirochaetae-5]|nr:MAG: riboflavin biosynthesis protein RibF [Spirochaetae bacterium HGW-Spirochaetae-5]
MEKSDLKIYNDIPENNGSFSNPVVTIGNFDGVHTGHRKIISKLIASAEEHNGVPIVITFRNHPRTLFHPESVCRMITTIEEKQRALHDLGINNIIMLNFTKEFAGLTADQFYNELLVGKLKIKEIVIGYDHAFGKDRQGNIDYLLKLSEKTGIIVNRVDEEVCDDEVISSTFLRDEIDKGNMKMVTRLLGRRYTLSGRVVKGAGRGRGLGYPTANILPDHADKIVPGNGIYAASITFKDNSVFNGMLNIGYNPTFNGKEKSIEINILDFNKDIYDEIVTLEFYEKIREEIKFDSADSLISKIRMDEIQIRGIFGNAG